MDKKEKFLFIIGFVTRHGGISKEVNEYRKEDDITKYSIALSYKDGKVSVRTAKGTYVTDAEPILMVSGGLRFNSIKPIGKIAVENAVNAKDGKSYTSLYLYADGTLDDFPIRIWDENCLSEDRIDAIYNILKSI